MPTTSELVGDRAERSPLSPETADARDAVVLLAGVWKIFGAREREAVEAIRREPLDKAQIAERYDCVVGAADINLFVRRGEIFCIMGLSGSGKSTVIRHINRLLDPSLGSISVEGEDIMSLSSAELRALRAHKIGMVFQSFGLLPHRTVRDNVALPLEIQKTSKQRRFDVAEAALAKVNLSGWGDRYCHELSGGMQQRVGLARALAADPSILLMDEPFSALDPLIRRQLQDEFLALSKSMGKTVIFITHDLEEAVRIGDRIAIMKDGAIIQTDTPEDLVMSPRHPYVSQFVAHISRMDVVRARSIMRSVDVLEAGELEMKLERLRRVPVHATLSDLVSMSADDAEPIAVEDTTGKVVGVIDRQSVLSGLRKRKI